MSENEDVTTIVELEPVRARGGWNPSALALMSEDEFSARVENAKKERQRIAEVQRSVMQEDVDYGTVPGTNKPSILKPGAETLNRLAGISASYKVQRVIGDGEIAPTIHYLVHCFLHERDTDGPVVAEGIGSCSTHERKYRYRRGGEACPECGQELRKSQYDKKEWYCWAKKGGCGKTFPADQFSTAMVVNPDPYDLDNTVLKMAKKRAYTDATLTHHAASGLFTQDVTDEPAEDEATAAKAKPRASAPQPPREEEPPPIEDPEPAKAAEPKTAAPKVTKGELTAAELNQMFKVATERAQKIGDESITSQVILSEVCKKELGYGSASEIPKAMYDQILRRIAAWEIPTGKERSLF